MPLFDAPMSFAARASQHLDLSSFRASMSAKAMHAGPMETVIVAPYAAKTPLGHLILLVFEAVLEVVCVSLPGYIVARQGMFNAESQKFVAELNVALFTPCLIFTKLASQLTSDKLAELAVIPVIFAVQTLVSYLGSIALSRAFGLKGKRPRNFVVAMSVFGNSNSLPISLVISLSKTISGLHWDRIPGDNDDEVAARGILYLLIFQQLGQLLRWSWGYHVLLAPLGPDERRIEEGPREDRYRDYPDADHEDLIQGEDPNAADDLAERALLPNGDADSTKGRATRADVSPSDSTFDSGGQTPVMPHHDASSVASDDHTPKPATMATPTHGNTILHHPATGDLSSFPRHDLPGTSSEDEEQEGVKGFWVRVRSKTANAFAALSSRVSRTSAHLFQRLPKPLQRTLTRARAAFRRFLFGLWAFMNPPLWAMLAAIIVASIPALQRLFFTPGTFMHNSVTSAVRQSGGVAIPLILVVLGANLARNTIPARCVALEDPKLNRKLLIASIVGRMVLPTIIMAPLLALAAKYVPVSILDDPIFVVICFLLSGAPSALQLAQICQINEVYETVMSKLLFQSYVIWILPSTLFLVMCALEVVRWADVG